MQKRKGLYKMLSILLTIATVISSLYIGNGNVTAKAMTDGTLEEYRDYLGSYAEVMDYNGYLDKYKTANRPDGVYEIDAVDYVRVEGMEVEELPDYEGMEGISILTDESGLIEYEVGVRESGFYDLSILYYPIKGKSAAIQRGFFIDGKLPYSQMSLIEFSRIWKNVEVENLPENQIWARDNQNNDIKPNQIEEPNWVKSYLYDSEGYITDNLSVFLSAGKHTITIVSQREPMVIRKIVLDNRSADKKYNDVIAEQEKLGLKDASNQFINIEAEEASRKSSPMLYPIQDKTSPEVTPYNVKELRNNTIGGNSWRLVGQWIEWDFDVKESGYYYITLHAKQNFVRGIYTSRRITIDGEVPFEELASYGFRYEQDWRMETLSNEEGTPYRIYLEAGSHTIRMENVLGKFAPIVNDVKDVMSELNRIYRKVIRITGVAPDVYRDYQIRKSVPGIKEELIVVRDNLNKVLDDLVKVIGKRSDKENSLIAMRDQLNIIIEDEEKFSEEIKIFKVNVSALGTWITQTIEQPLQLDAIYVYSPDQKLPKVNNSFLSKLVHEIKSLFYSFIIDYNRIGSVVDGEEDAKNDKNIKIWVGTGRDQANVIKSMIDKDFTNKTGINVNVMLVDMGTLLQATLAGQGPDVALQVANDLPMNYGVRNAVADLSQFGDLEEVTKRFHETAMTPYSFEGKTFALPETQTFLMMFYRKDILKELGIQPPKTWNELKVTLSVLSKNQMDVGMIPNDLIFSMLLYQNGGQYYNDMKTASALDSNEGIKAFREFIEYYTLYKLDRETSLEQRFRTGEAPIIIADYTVYNNFQVSAPDIKGLWGFTSVPGTVQEDGTINNTVASGGTASIMLEKCKDKESAWEFMKWWTSEETQINYAREMEGLMGPSARYPTANLAAFEKLPWPVEDYQNLINQYQYIKGVPQIPGSYYNWRNVNNAFYKVVVSTDKSQPRETLTDYVRLINAEITHKRKEFGLKTIDDVE